MKIFIHSQYRLATVLILLVASHFSYGQANFRLWGTADRGPQGNGTIFSLMSDGTGFNNEINFSANPDGGFRYGYNSLMIASDGKIYGVTHDGGLNNNGVIFRMDQDGSNYTKVYVFPNWDTGVPHGKLLEGIDGFLYGVGEGGNGSLYKIKKDGTGYIKLKQFTPVEGGVPLDGVVQGADEKLYGMTGFGGTNGAGVVYKINPDGTGFQKLTDLSFPTGGYPFGRPLLASNQYLYGLTWMGGANSRGVLFRIKTDGTAFSVLIDFGLSGGPGVYDINGSNPFGTMIQGSDGDLYGVTSGGGSVDEAGILFKIKLDGSGFTKLYSFISADGREPQGTLLEYSPGNLIGVLGYGATNNNGSIYKIGTDGNGFTKFASFDGLNGSHPLEGLVVNPSGDFFGAATNGGAADNGVIYKLSSGGSLTKLKDFPIDVPKFLGNLMQTTSGDIYGVGPGGAYGHGTIFKFRRDGTSYAKVYDFPTGDPYGQLFETSGGELLGITNQSSSVFKLSPGTNSVSPLLDLDARFSVVRSNFIQLPGGDIIATSNSGRDDLINSSNYNSGWIFKFAPDGTSVTTLLRFDPNESMGYNEKELVLASDGLLYGVATNGGVNGTGTVFKLNTNGTGFVKIYDFLGSRNGIAKGLVEGADGFLYGIKSDVGNSVLFKISKDGLSYAEIVQFDGVSKGDFPRENIIFGPDGFIYGTASQGGANNLGVVYKVRPDGTEFTRLTDFNRQNGLFPSGKLLIVPIVAPVVTGFSPLSGIAGSTVTVTGTNFSSTPSNNIVYFGAATATVTAASPTSLTVVVPAGATYRPISVTKEGYTDVSDRPFILTSQKPLDAASFARKTDFISGASPKTLAIGDIDKDGKDDVAIANSNSNTISIYKNINSGGDIESGVFAPKVDITTGPSPYGIAIADIDNDGKLDVIVSNGNGDNVSVYRNISTPGTISSASFAAPVNFATGILPIQTVTHDLDGDGKSEIIVVNSISKSISVLRNMSTPGDISSGSFDGKVDYTISGGAGLTSVNVADVDGDKKPDLVVASNVNFISIFKNTTTKGASFSAASFATNVDFNISATNNARSVSIGDLDGDSKPEIVVGAGGTDQTIIAILRNTTSVLGSITTASFAPKFYLPSDGFQSVGTIADFTGDGKLDLIMVNAIRKIGVYKNISSPGALTAGSFATSIDFPITDNLRAVAVADLNADGAMEFLTVTDAVIGLSVFSSKIPYPTITSLTPSSGRVGTAITIAGTNFDPTPALNSVKFNGVAATVTASSATSITVTVPAGALTGPVTIVVNSLSGANTNNFTVIPPPSITGFSVPNGTTGATVVILGDNFDLVANNNVVKFNGTQSTATASTINSITTFVPAAASTGPVTVTIGIQTATSPTNFTVLNVTGDLHNFLPEKNINVYPNPAKGIITIKINDFDNSEISTIKILDLTGHVMDNLTTTGAKIDVELSAYTHGMYIVTAIQGDKIYRATFIKK